MQALLDSLVEHWMVHVLLVLYTAMMAWHAYEGKRETKGLADYYVGGRGMGGLVLGLSFFATYSSTNSFVGFSGQAYGWGAPWLLLVPFVVGMSLFAWLAVAPRLRDLAEALDSVTIPDFIGFRFDSTSARVFAALIVLVASVLYMTAVFKGIGNLLEIFLEIPYRTAILLVFVVVMLYTAVGGFISVVKTDAVQGVVMSVAAVLLFGGAFTGAGGFGALGEMAAAPETDHLFQWGGGVAVPVLLGVLFASTVKFAAEPRQLSRFYALIDRGAARKGLWVSTLTFAAVYGLLAPVGLFARRVVPAGIEDTDRVVPTMLAGELFPEAVGAFLVVAMVAAAMSSLDSVLLVTASTAERDLVGLLRPDRDEGSAVLSTRMLVVVFATVTTFISLDPPGTIVTLTAFSGSLYGVCFLPAVLFGLHWRRGSGPAVIASFAAGIGGLLLWPLTPWAGFLHEVFPALVLSTAAYAAGSRAAPAVQVPAVEAFFRDADLVGAEDSP